MLLRFQSGEVADTYSMRSELTFSSHICLFCFTAVVVFTSSTSNANLFNCNHTFLRSLTAIYVRGARGCIVVEEAIATTTTAIILLASPAKSAPTANKIIVDHAGLLYCLPSLSSLDSRVDNCHNMQIFHSVCAYVIHLFRDANVKMLYNSICILLNCVCSSLSSSSSSSSQFHVKQFCAHHHFNRNIYMVLNCRFAPAHFWASQPTKD